MKINIKRTDDVTNNIAVQFIEPGKVKPYSGGTFAGIVSDCREITMLENEIETVYKICTLSIKGPAVAVLSGTAAQNGSTAYLNGERVASSGSNPIGVIVARPFPESGDYADGDLVNVVLT